MTKKTLNATFVSFLSHHSNDLRTLASVIGQIIDAVPVNAGTRAVIDASLSGILKASNNIDASLKTVRAIPEDTSTAVKPRKPTPKVAPETVVKNPGDTALDVSGGAEPTKVDAPVPPTAATGGTTRGEESA